MIRSSRASVALLLALLLAACGGGRVSDTDDTSEAAPQPEVTQIVEGGAAEITAVVATVTLEGTNESDDAASDAGATEESGAVAATPEPERQPTAGPSPTLVLPVTVVRSPPPAPLPTIVLTPAPVAEERVVEVEWPPQMRLGDSGLVRLALVPQRDGYVVTTEFPDNRTVTETLAVTPRAGYDLAAVARLDAAGFEQAPQGEQPQSVVAGEPLEWRWTLVPQSAGQHRLAVSLWLRWTPLPDNPNPTRESVLLSRGLTVQVSSFLGMSTNQAMATGLLGLVVGSTLSLPALLVGRRPARARLQTVAPNSALAIEAPPALPLGTGEQALLRALFHRYARLTVEAEFRSGYSGARILLALPVRADGRADAYTIVKLGDRAAIGREFDNYERFVKDTLPPITARIQAAPVTLPATRRAADEGLAALRYTFIGEPGTLPTSLRQAMLANPDPALLEKLFRTFGPNWWMQRRPYTFRLGEEYDRMLPAHLVLEPAPGGAGGRVLDGRASPADLALGVGEMVTLRGWTLEERWPRKGHLSLVGARQPGQPPLRLRWLTAQPVARGTLDGARGRVVATRETLLRDTVAGFDLLGLPDPLAQLSALLAERVRGTQSVIHGDLNLENALVGPGDFVWLIDFAQTREGHPLADFAHLEAELIAQIIAARRPAPAAFLEGLRADSDPLLATMHRLAARCLFDPDEPREYHLALTMACLGALKYANLAPFPKHLLYLTAAHFAEQ